MKNETEETVKNKMIISYNQKFQFGFSFKNGLGQIIKT